MVLMLDLQPELEERLRREAEQRGIPAEEYAARILDQSLHSEDNQDSLQLATSIYDGLDDEEVDEIEKIILNRRPLFNP